MLVSRSMQEEKDNYKSLQSLCLSNGASLFGVADVRELRDEFSYLRSEVIANLDRGVSVGFRLSDTIIEGIVDRPTEIYFHHYKQVNYFLDRLALLVANFIQDRGGKALPVPASQVVNREKQEGHVSHKRVAVQAGLGWLGRNNLVVNPKLGSRARFVTILTDFPLTFDKSLEMDCGECRECLDCCPAGAIKEKRVDFDHRGCFKQLGDFRRTRNIGHHICGICVKACVPPRGPDLNI